MIELTCVALNSPSGKEIYFWRRKQLRSIFKYFNSKCLFELNVGLYVCYYIFISILNLFIY